jgi:hypothetical protein
VINLLDKKKGGDLVRAVELNEVFQLQIFLLLSEDLIKIVEKIKKSGEGHFFLNILIFNLEI